MSDSTPDKPTKQSWWQRLSAGLKRTSASIGTAISDLVSKRKLDKAMLEEIEEVLIRADLGVETAGKIAAAVGEGRYDKAISPEEVKAVLAAEVEKVLAPLALPLAHFHFRPHRPHHSRIGARQADPRRQQRHVVGFVARLFGLAAAA